MIQIYNEDNMTTIDRMIKDGTKVDVVLTSPPYFMHEDNASTFSERRYDIFVNHYDVFEGYESEEEYTTKCVDLFNGFAKILKHTGVVLWNVSYSTEHPDTMWHIIHYIMERTPFTVADCIIWKKNCALPSNRNANRLTRICEFVFVFCFDNAMKDFYTSKIKLAPAKYTNVATNFISAANNDGPSKKVNRFNNAVFSVDLCTQLFDIYAPEGGLVYDPFMGTGTTAVACKVAGLDCIGSEISKAQCDLANDRLSGHIITRETGNQLLF